MSKLTSTSFWLSKLPGSPVRVRKGREIDSQSWHQSLGKSRRGFEPGSASQESPGPQHKSTRNTSNAKAVQHEKGSGENLQSQWFASKRWRQECLTACFDIDFWNGHSKIMSDIHFWNGWHSFLNVTLIFECPFLCLTFIYEILCLTFIFESDIHFCVWHSFLKCLTFIFEMDIQK